MGHIKRVKNDIDFRELVLGEECGRGVYYLEHWQNIEIYFEDIGLFTLVFPHNHRRYNFRYSGIGKDRYFFGEEYHGKFCILYAERGIYKIRENKEKNYCELDPYFLEEGYKTFHLSQDLMHLRSKVKMAYGLEYSDKKEKVLIFGVYNGMDLDFLKGCQEYGILWGGSDIMLDKKTRRKALDVVKMSGCVNYAMSGVIERKLVELGMQNIRRVVVSFCGRDRRYLMRNLSLEKKRGIYIYDGLDKSEKKRVIYNQDIVDDVVSRLGKFEIYRSSDGYVENILELYHRCFVGIRLTQYDGNANMAQECGMLGIPVISNQEMNHCVSWRCGEEVERKVNYIWEKGTQIHWRQDGTNLLFISGDLPGLGGGATFTGVLVDYLRGRGFNIYEVYLMHSEKREVTWDQRRLILRFNQRKKWDLLGLFEEVEGIEFHNFLRKCRIVLRSAISDIQKVRDRFDVIFLIPGLYRNEMGGVMEVKYVNESNLKNSKAVRSYANSAMTQSMYHRYGLNEVGLLEVNLLQLQGPHWNNSRQRDIDFLFVVSNLGRRIKNFDLFKGLALAMREYRFVVISAEEVEDTYENVEFVIHPPDMESYYQRSRCLVNCSYFDSMSNVVLEGIKGGCHVLISQYNGLAGYISEKAFFVVEGYKLEEWESKAREILGHWNDYEENRQMLYEDLKRRSWEVEIRLLDILN